MSDIQQTTSLIKLATLFKDELVSQVVRTSTLAASLQAFRGRNAAGPNWVAVTDGHLANTHAEGSTVSDFGSDGQEQATLGWGLYEAPFHVSDEAMSRARASGNPTGNVDLWLRNMKGAVEKLSSKLNQDCYNGSGSNSIIGLESALDDANEYAGLDRSTEAYWRATVKEPATLTELTKAQVEGDLADIAIAGGRRPNIAMCSPKVFVKLLSLFETQREFITVASGGLKSNSLGDATLSTVSISGCRFVEDVDGYAADDNGTIYYLNTDHVYFEWIPYVVDPSMGGNVSVASPLPFGIDFKPLPSSAHSSKAMARCQVQLVVDRPNRCGIRRNIDVSE